MIHITLSRETQILVNISSFAWDLEASLRSYIASLEELIALAVGAI